MNLNPNSININISRWNQLYKQKRLKTNQSLYCEICGWTGYQDPTNSISIYHFFLSNPIYIKPNERDEELECINIKDISNSVLMLCPNHLSVLNQIKKNQKYIDLLNIATKPKQEGKPINRDLILMKKDIINLLLKFEIEYMNNESNTINLSEKIWCTSTKQYFIPTGEFRTPKQNEYYLNGIGGRFNKVVQAEQDMKMERIILIPQDK